MSREVRRVPLGWEHPTEYNPHWVIQSQSAYGRSKPASRLHTLDQRFIGLMDDYPGRRSDWEQELREVKAREGHRWTFGVEYHLTGFQGRDDNEPTVHPLYGWSDDGQTETSTECRDEDHLYEYLVAETEAEEPKPENYMPVFDVPADQLGWVLYETVSEGTPVTPVFATAEELIDHLATVGQDWNQEPMRRSSAEALVKTGFSMGTFVVAGNTLYKSDEDADVLSGGAS